MGTTVNVTVRLSCCSSIVISIAGRSAAGPGVDDRLHALPLTTAKTRRVVSLACMRLSSFDACF
jgi:hypothetical protein